jgi:hypothetical protein
MLNFQDFKIDCIIKDAGNIYVLAERVALYIKTATYKWSLGEEQTRYMVVCLTKVALFKKY